MCLCVCVYAYAFCASVITELARSSKAFAELGGRTQPLVADIVVALVEMGRLLTHVLFTFNVDFDVLQYSFI